MLLTQFNDIFFCCCLGLKTVCRQTKSQSRKGDNWKGDKRKVRRITLPRKKTFKKLICVLEPRFRILSLVFVESKHLKGQLDPPVCNVTLLDHQVVLNGLNKLVIFVFSRLVYLIQVKPWISFFHSICIHFEWTHAQSLRLFPLFFFRKYCFQNQGLQVQEVCTLVSQFVNFASEISLGRRSYQILKIWDI